MANYFMNMYSVAPVSIPNVVPLTTINHSDPLALSIPTVPNISNNNSVRTSASQMVSHPSSHAATAGHPNAHQHMHMANQSSGSNHRAGQHATQPQHPQPLPAHTGQSSHHQTTATTASSQSTTQRAPAANRTMNVSCETPYMCGVCSQSFRKPGSLKKHMRVHMSSNVSIFIICKLRSKSNCVLTSIHLSIGPHRQCTATSTQVHAMRLLPTNNANIIETIPLRAMCHRYLRSI